MRRSADGRAALRAILDTSVLIAATAHGARLYTCNPGDLMGADELIELVEVIDE